MKSIFVIAPSAWCEDHIDWLSKHEVTSMQYSPAPRFVNHAHERMGEMDLPFWMYIYVPKVYNGPEGAVHGSGEVEYRCKVIGLTRSKVRIKSPIQTFRLPSSYGKYQDNKYEFWFKVEQIERVQTSFEGIPFVRKNGSLVTYADVGKFASAAWGKILFTNWDGTEDKSSVIAASQPSETFIQNPKDLIDSVVSFMAAPEYWRDAIGNNPIYFVHYRSAGDDLFGLSKFCAFKGISLEDYVVNFRHTTNGNITQNHISKIVKKSWMPLDKCDKRVILAFERWFEAIPNNKIKLDGIRLISVDSSDVAPVMVKKAISPAELEKRLKNQREIGIVGEAIALKYELDRLRLLGIKDPEKYVQHVSLLNAGAGYDIRSSSRLEDRYIEVKSSTVKDGTFYISPNELQTLEKHCDKAYLYIVHVQDRVPKIGSVVAVIRDPVAELKGNDSLTPVMFQGKLEIPK